MVSLNRAALITRRKSNMSADKKLRRLRQSTLFIICLATGLSSALLFSTKVSANSPVTDSYELPEFTAKYAVKKFGIKLAEAKYRLRYTDTGYKILQNTDLYGLAVYLSNYAVAAESLVDRYKDNLLLKKHVYILSGSDEDKDENIDFHWHTDQDKLNGKVTGIVRGQEINVEAGDETWDLLSFQIPLMIQANKDLKEYSYDAIVQGEIDSYTFELREIKKVTFADKEYAALRMVCPDSNRDRELHIWLLPELHNIPVLIENYRKGRVHYSGSLESVQFNNDPPIIEDIKQDPEDDIYDDDY